MSDAGEVRAAKDAAEPDLTAEELEAIDNVEWILRRVAEARLHWRERSNLLARAVVDLCKLDTDYRRRH